MQGNIDFSGTLSGSIAGGGGGSAVTITPTLQSGTKIADYTIDSESGSLYAPTPPQSGVIDVQVNNTQVPDYESIVENNVAKLNLYPYMEKSETYTLFDLLNDEIELVDGKVGGLEQIVPTKQDRLIAGNNISIENNVISASGGSGLIDYVSDTKIGTWDNGDLYQAELTLDIRNGLTFDLSSLNIAKVRQISAYEEDSNGDYLIKIPYYESSNYWAYFQYRNSTHELTFVGSNNNFSGYIYMKVIIEYKKSV